MNSSQMNLTSIFNFITLLLSQSRSLFAMIALAAWLFISISFYWSQSNQNEEVDLNDLSSPISRFWHEYGWQYVNLNPSLASVYFVNDQQGWAVGFRGTILATQDGGKNWNEQNSNSIASLSSVHFVNDQQGWAVGSDETILATQDGGKNWNKQNSNSTGWLSSVHFVNAQQGWAVGSDETILATQDGGKNWNKQNSNSIMRLSSVHFVNDQQGWVVGIRGTILATQDSGKNWNKQNSNSIAGLSVHFVNNQQGWAVGNDGTILATQDGGESWITARLVKPRLPDWYWFFSVLCVVIFLLGMLSIRAPTRSDAISAMLSSDRPRRGNESDALESKKLAWALSRFLRHQRTEPPLTLAINAPWGGGKSSLMNWLREDLERFGFHPVWFNAWHYEKQEQMFPALLETIRQQAVPSSWLSWSNVKFRRRLLWHRIKIYPWLTGLLFILICFPIGYFYTNVDKTWASIRTQAVWSLEQAFPRHSASTLTNTIDTIAASATPPKPRNKPDKAHEIKLDQEKKSIPDGLTLLLSLFPGLVPLIGLWKGLQSFSVAGNWLSRWLNPTEQSKATLETAYRAQFARDFHAVTSALDHTLIIFIDDLDRCQPESVCEVMETVNFLASEGSCYIVLGIWREGVERAIGLGFSEAAKEFSQISNLQIENENPSEINVKGNSAHPDDAEIRRRYGQLYLEKLINIWVSVPTLEITAAQNMLRREQNPPQQLASLAITTSRIKSFLHSGFKDWRDQLWGLYKQFYATICKLRALEIWRGLRWANPISMLWRFLAYLTVICISGAFLVLLIRKTLGYFNVYIASSMYSDLLNSMEPLLGLIGAALLLFLLHGFILKWIYRGLQFAVLRRLPTKPFSQTWLINLLIITAIIITGSYAFQFGKDWSSSPAAHQKNTFSDRSSAQNSTVQTNDTAHSSTAPVPDSNQETPTPEHENQKIFTTKIAAQEEFDWLMLIMFGISGLIWIEWLRFRLELPDDSPAFEESLLFWSPVLTKRFDTPRRLKRFINHLRFNAMRLRTLQKPDTTQWEQFWNRYIRGEQLDSVREDEMQGKESSLLLLCVLEACCGADLTIKSMLVNADSTGNGNQAGKAFQSGWEERLRIDAQLAAENGTAWANELRRLLIERLKYFESNAMPQPTLADLRQFEALAPARITPASVRSAGISEQAAAWDQKIERRILIPIRRATISDTTRFVSDRRSGWNRRKQQASL
ncbi:YCF48-related protein [Nitrosomonas sp.]|uniref:YCF48-related protein n=1 Tax=Nitrosomonas sp. TaxID=42353 RepID=UPI0027304CDD|nr:YCF48-related protein [Nitrosomonas sp.]MDP1786982.1 YCF48-related protein [Nitrosomonas sp.]